MHICEIPTTRTTSNWWTCEACGQIWRKVTGHWRMTPLEAEQ